jgi:hypothetical protein
MSKYETSINTTAKPVGTIFKTELFSFTELLQNHDDDDDDDKVRKW